MSKPGNTIYKHALGVLWFANDEKTRKKHKKNAIILGNANPFELPKFADVQVPDTPPRGCSLETLRAPCCVDTRGTALVEVDR